MASDQERKERVTNGSRRKRDLAAAGISPSTRPREEWQRNGDAEHEKARKESAERQAREDRLRPQVVATEKSDEAWPAIRARLKRTFPATTWHLWLQPVTVIGEVNGALALAASTNTMQWTEKRYGAAIGEAVRAESDYKGAFLFIGKDAEPEREEGLL